MAVSVVYVCVREREGGREKMLVLRLVKIENKRRKRVKMRNARVHRITIQLLRVD